MKKTIAAILVTGTLGAGGTFAADRAVDPYVDEGTHYELEIKSDIPQGERVEISKTEAAMTLKGWNDEYAITIKPQIPAAAGVFGASERDFKVDANRPLLSKKMEYRTGDVTAFIEPRAGTENEFDIDFTLHSKPDTNIFEYKIEGAEEFKFCFQPPIDAMLAAEERAENPDWCDPVWIDANYDENASFSGADELSGQGFKRPQDVVGSYAIYHQTKANHRTGFTNYAVGKIAHIKRPKVIDAGGKEQWAKLSYTNGVLSVSVPIEFLDTATYPVIVDPTFGYTSVGATFSGNYCTATSDGSTTAGVGFLLEDNGTLDSLHVAFDSSDGDTETVDQSAMLYEEQGGGTGSHSLVALVEETAQSVTATAAFNTFTASSQSLSQLKNYIVAGLCDGVDVGDGSVVVVLDSSGGIDRGRFAEESTGAGGYATRKAEDPWVTSNLTTGAQQLSIYATYTSTGSDFFTGTVGADIGFCYQAGTAACFTGLSNPNSNTRMGFRVGVNNGSITTGFRFPAVDVPQGATIDAAYFYYTGFDSDSTSPPTVLVFAEDVDDSPTFTTTGADAPDTVAFGGSRATTTASVSWTMTDNLPSMSRKSPDIKTVVQEVTDRAGWASGNDLSIILGPSDLVDNFNAKNATSSAYLIIDFTEPAAQEGSPATHYIKNGDARFKNSDLRIKR